MKRVFTALLLIGFFAVRPASAQLDGTRVYWPLPKNMNVLGVHVLNGTANATLTNLTRIQPSFDIESQLYLLTYSRSQPILGRSFVVTATLPAGVIRTDSSLPVSTNDRFVHGVGDPSIAASINIFGAPGLMLREFARYDLHTVAWLSLTATFPLGYYKSSEPINIGSNQTKLRVAIPLVRSLGPWVPGDRMTIEVIPSVTILSDNDDAQGYTLNQDPFVAMETHLTRDITRMSSISLDYSYLRFGASTLTSNSSSEVLQRKETSSHLLGLTMNFQINDNMSLFVSHLQTIGRDEDLPISLEGALFRATLTWSFHRVIERRRAFAD